MCDCLIIKCMLLPEFGNIQQYKILKIWQTKTDENQQKKTM